MAEFVVYPSGGCWIAKRKNSPWTSGFERTEGEAVRSAQREARVFREARITVRDLSGRERVVANRDAGGFGAVGMGVSMRLG
jgi:hypothetical protein